MRDRVEPILYSCSDQTVVLSTHGLTKDFKKLRAVDRLELSVCRGDIFGFLGPNGAGKTTTIPLIFGLIYPTSGTRRSSITGFLTTGNRPYVMSAVSSTTPPSTTT